jgi:uncharacterized protein (DUF433 family)
LSTQSTTYVHLAPNPKSAPKQLFVKRTRIRARVLYGWYACEELMTPEEIACEFGLPVEVVREAIAYCESNLYKEVTVPGMLENSVAVAAASGE